MKIVYGLLCLVILILFHELGHFLAAKLSGVKVEAFSVGFGPVILHRRIGGTDYRLSLLPFGGYCAMKGEKDFSESLKAGLDHIEPSEGSLYAAHPARRIAIAFAGPFANFIFAFLAFFTVALAGYSYHSYSTKIILADEIHPGLHSAAREAGLLTGDVILKINGRETRTFSDILIEVSTRPDEVLSVTAMRDGKEFSVDVRPVLDRKTNTGKIGVSADSSSLEKFEEPPLPFFPAVRKASSDLFKGIFLTVRGILTLFRGADITDSVSGPARVVGMLGGVVEESFSEGFRALLVNVLGFMAYISISLMIMNLLPVPVLDGGLIVFAFLELALGRKLSPKLLYYIQFFGVAVILLLFAVGITGDVKYFMNRFN